MSRREQAKRALRTKFLVVARERLASLGAALVELEARPDDEAIGAGVMREIHTLKGEAKLVGFDEMNQIAHRTEELLLLVREASAESRKAAFTTILRAIDLMTTLAAQDEEGASPEVDVAAFLLEADSARSGITVAASSPEVERPRSSSSGATQRLMGARGDTSIRIDLSRLHSLTDLAGALLLEHERSEALVTSFESIADRWLAEVERMEMLVWQLQREGGSAKSPILSEIATRARTFRAWRSEARSSIGRGREDLFEFRLQLEELDAQIRDLRLQPLSAAFRQYPRAVRDLANEQNKRIELVVEGGDVEVDKEVLERLADPLLHLIRNAVDHGLETPEERRARGKDETGTLTLSARQRGPFVEIRVADDGRGIDAAKVRRTAVRRGVMAQGMADARTDEEILALIFEPGFSTMETATDLSGRGVGLDVVKAHVEALGGQVSVTTELGRGTSFVLTAPIAMVFTRALLVACGEMIYAIPSEAVVRILHVKDSEIEHVGDGRALRLDEEWLPIFDLRTAVASSGSASRPSDDDATCVMIVEHLERRLAVIVGAFVGERQIVQRSFDAYLSGNRLLGGAAILNSGALAVLLDVGELVRIGRSTTGAARFAPVSVDEAPSAASARILVVDDSEITRDLVSTVLRSRGYEVLEAINGRDGIQRIEADRPDLVVTDLEMPVLDGFGLLAEVRARVEWKTLPVIVFSTRGSETDRRKAAELGADAYLVKSSFREEELIALAKRFVGERGA